nr:hypothetical protein [Nitrosomonas nitrosa]
MSSPLPPPRTRKRRWIWGVLALSVVVWIAFGPQPRDLVRVRAETVKTEPLSDFLARNYNPRAARSNVALDMSTLAALAANVYELAGTVDSTCSANVAGRIPLPGWEQIKGWSYPEACNAALNGLHYEVWQRMDSEYFRYVAVVFRGTVPQIMAHWCTNLRTARPPACDPSSDQYLSIVPLIDEVLSGDYDDWGPDRYVVAVGHSLGGGLAELAGRSSFINDVFAFDPSPVSGGDLSKAFQNEGDGARADDVMNRFLKESGCKFRNTSGGRIGSLTVHRVYEHGEVLAYPRLLKRWISPLIGESPSGLSRVVEFRTNVLEGGPLSKHSMKALACTFKRASASSTLGAATSK